jgi:hypothetical protein
MNTSELDNNPRVIVKFHGRVGRAYWSLDTNDFIYDAEGRPIPVGVKVVRCAHCGAVKKVRG